MGWGREDELYRNIEEFVFDLPGLNNVVKRLAQSYHDKYHRDVDTVVTQMRKGFWVNVQRRILSVIDNNFKALIDPILGEEKVTPTKKMALDSGE